MCSLSCVQRKFTDIMRVRPRYFIKVETNVTVQFSTRFEHGYNLLRSNLLREIFLIPSCFRILRQRETYSIPFEDPRQPIRYMHQYADEYTIQEKLSSRPIVIFTYMYHHPHYSLEELEDAVLVGVDQVHLH